MNKEDLKFKCGVCDSCDDTGAVCEVVKLWIRIEHLEKQAKTDKRTIKLLNQELVETRKSIVNALG